MGWGEVWAVDDGLGNSCRLGDVKKRAGWGWLGSLFYSTLFGTLS